MTVVLPAVLGHAIDEVVHEQGVKASQNYQFADSATKQLPNEAL
jgi:hypothetical protein